MAVSLRRFATLVSSVWISAAVMPSVKTMTVTLSAEEPACCSTRGSLTCVGASSRSVSIRPEEVQPRPDPHEVMAEHVLVSAELSAAHVVAELMAATLTDEQ